MASWLGKPSVEVKYNNIHINFLPLNYAYVILNTTWDHIGVYSVSEDCYKCPYKRQKDKDHFYGTDKNAVYEVYAGEQTKWRILNHGHEDYIQQHYRGGLLCDLKATVEEYGVYRLDVGKCVMETEVPPVNVYLPLLFFSLIMLSGITILALVKLFLRRNKRYNDGLNLTAKRDNLNIMPSLHFLRGLLLMLIIFVTTGGGGYPIFNKNYGGLTVANCLLFAYTFSIGLKIPIMFEEDSRKAISKWTMFYVICLRSFVLLFLGIAISNVAPRSRYLGVPLWAPLPSIALSYLMVAAFYIISTDKRGKSKNSPGTAGTLFWSWFFGAFLLIITIVSIHIFYYTECKQYTEFDPHRNSWVANGNNCKEDDVFSEVFNKNLLSVNRDEPFYIDYYYAFTEGILGIISCMLTSLIGLKAGVIYVENEDHKIRMKQWCLWAAVSGVTGVILATASGPLNFNLCNAASPLDFKYIGQLRFVMSSIGCWPHDQFGLTRLDYVLSKYNMVLVIIALILLMSATTYIRVNRAKISFFDLGHILLCIVFELLFLQRLLLARLDKYREAMRDYLLEFHLFYFKSRSEYAAKMHSQIHLISGLITVYGMCIVAAGVSLFTFMPWFNNYMRGMFRDERPANITFEHAVYYYVFTDAVYTTIEGYWMLFAFNLPISYTTSIGLVIWDLLLSLIVFQIWGHLRLLKHNLLSMPLPEKIEDVMYTAEENVHIRKLLRENIVHHKSIVTFVDKCSYAFSEYLLVFYTLMQFMTCILLVEVSSLTPDAIAKYGPLTLALHQQLIQVSILFEMLNTKSEQLIEAVYAVPWECMDTSNRRTVLFFLQRVQTPVSLKAGKVVPVGVTTMSSVLKTTFSYYMLLKTMANEK